MLKDLLQVLRHDSRLDDAFRKSHEMLAISGEMFLSAKNSLRHSDSSQLDESVRELDKKINKYERKVRKKVLQHLAIAGSDRLVSGLTLVSIIIDIERTGDYCKNIVELARNHPERLQAGSAEEQLQKVEDAVVEAFEKLNRILQVSDALEAEEFIQSYSWVNPLCDQQIRSYIRAEDPSIPVTDAVTLALYFRYLKRINSHLRNIATSVYRPFHKIGFVPSKDKIQELDDE
jgi:phosphate uptake regulator